MTDILVLKHNTAGEETWRYTGQLVFQQPNAVVIRALFNRPDTPFHDILLKEGDVFYEIYYTDRWFNIYEIHDRDDHQLKGWYCNITLPAEVEGNVITFVDLALDLLVYPDGRHLVLDEEEFFQLDISPDMRHQALDSLQQLKCLFKPPVLIRLDLLNGQS